MNEWEEEISRLKLQLDEFTIVHEEEILALTEKVNHKKSSLINYKNSPPNNKDTMCINCCNPFSLSKKRKQLGQSWAQVVRSETSA